MFGLTGLEAYFFVNMSYTLVQFFLLHDKIAHRAIENDKKNTGNIGHIDVKEHIEGSMTTYYILGIFFGSWKFLKDFSEFVGNPSNSLWIGKVKDEGRNRWSY